MTRKKLIPTGAALLAALGIAAGGVAFAQNNSDESLQSVLAATPSAAEGVTAVEAQTGGKVVDAEMEDDAPDLIEFEDEMADGSEADVYWSVADATVVTEADLLARFVEATPGATDDIAAVEARTGGTVFEAETGDDASSVIEFEVRTSDGKTVEALYTVADGTVALEDADGDEGEDYDDDA